MKTIATAAWAFVLLPLAAVVACSSTGDYPIGSDCAHGFCEQEPSFNPPADAGDASIDPLSVPMCPATTCSFPWTTCPSSEFPCSSNLLNDDDNCGGCGIRCAGENAAVTQSKWTCAGGQCAFSCTTPDYQDCDNDPGNGCETFITFNHDNCGGCGIKCEHECNDGVCSGQCPFTYAPDICGDGCVNLQTDDYNCGTCGNVCDATGPNLPALPEDMYYGCGNGICGQRRCSVPNTADCNNDTSDSCEVKLTTNDHCAGCFDACPAGKTCGYTGAGALACLCLDDAETFCSHCVRLADDPQNCGACDAVCPGFARPHFEATCTFGVCGGQCEANYADCDALSDNACEVNTLVDNRNCGACGNACLSNQACSQGKCLMTPCDAGAPGVPVK